MRSLLVATLLLAFMGTPAHSAEVLAFEGTAPPEDHLGSCAAGSDVPGRAQLVAVYWSAWHGPAYYFSVLIVERGSRFTVRREPVPAGVYRVSVFTKKLTPGARPSCVAVDSIATRAS